MTDIRFPLSGGVAQAINPWEFWIRSISTQTGFINIANLNTADPALEREIVENVASYGRQLGRINDVLTVLADRLDPATLSPDEHAALGAFRVMTADIEAVKQRSRSPRRLLAALDSLLRDLARLKTTHPDVYVEAVARLREGLREPGGTERRQGAKPVTATG